jgi:hypothetical protein
MDIRLGTISRFADVPSTDAIEVRFVPDSGGGASQIWYGRTLADLVHLIEKANTKEQ